VVGGDDRLTVALGGELSAEFGPQLVAELEVVVDLAVEHQRVPVRRLRRTPAQRLMAVGDVDDRQAVEAEHDGVMTVARIAVVGPGARLVRTAVTHRMRGVRNGVHQVSGMVGNRVGQVGQQSAHGASMPVQAGELRTGAADWPVASLGIVGVVYAA
jgi:hypothetical protein